MKSFQLIWVFAFIGAGAFLPATTSAENYAFLVAVGDYDAKHLRRLDYARNDIFALAESLQQAGFDEDYVVVMHDDVARLEDLDNVSDADNIREQFPLLLSNVQPDDTLIVAFAGHGVQFKGEAESYFCARDADLDDPQRSNLIAISEIYDALQDCPARRKLLLVDACRNDPQSRLSRTTSPDILESVTQPQLTPPPEGVVALFSCAEGQEAFEHPDLEHGIFFYHVLQALAGEADDGDNALTLDEFLAYTKRRTATYARLELNASQTPRQRGFFEGEWILREILQSFAGRSAGDLFSLEDPQMSFVWCPAGSFQFAVPPQDPVLLHAADFSFRPRERRQRVDVTLTRGFWIGQHEVTQSVWQRVMGTRPWENKTALIGEIKVGMRYPAVWITWDQADEFCEVLTERELAMGRLPTGWKYTLPTEAQWEYASRCGRESRFAYGDDAERLIDYAWFSDAASEVGRKTPNPWGIRDMFGNAGEWCLDFFAEPYLGGIDPVIDDDDENVVMQNGQRFHVMRGSAFWYGVESLYDVQGYTPDAVNELTGFRVAIVPVPD